MDDYEGTGGEPQDGGGLRRQLEQALADKKAAEEAREAAVAEAEARGVQKAQRRFDALKEFGSDRPGLADAWLAANPEGDITPEIAKEFAQNSFGITLGEQAPTPTPEPERIAPEVRQAVQAFEQPVATEPAQNVYSPEEFRDALVNPALRDDALKADREGRVQRKARPRNTPDSVLPGFRDEAGLLRRP